MSQSSCRKHLSIEEEEVKLERIKDIELKSENFLRQVALNLCRLEGISGRLDIAFKIKRAPIIARVMKKIAKELLDEA